MVTRLDVDTELLQEAIASDRQATMETVVAWLGGFTHCCYCTEEDWYSNFDSLFESGFNETNGNFAADLSLFQTVKGDRDFGKVVIAIDHGNQRFCFDHRF
jgi:hypothetical protein